MKILENILTTIFLVVLVGLVLSFMPWGRTADNPQALAPAVELLKSYNLIGE